MAHSPKRNRPVRGAAPRQPWQVDTIHSTSPLDTDAMKVAAVRAFQTGNRVRLCDDTRCVDVIPDVEVAELLANGVPHRPTWLHINSSKTFPGRRAYVYAVPGVAA